jgi:demethylmenaquinone methyltransferase/2-methoxy-6-polyprenyl-1,4-benzoquinol methylase
MGGPESKNPESNWFGERKVAADEKTRLVRGVFDSVAEKYDLMNDLMSGGLHRLWKDRLIREIRPRPGLAYLDVAGGTGDIAFRLRRAAGEGAKITVCDLDEAMLRVGRDRAADRGYFSGIDWVAGNAEALPLPDESVDVYTIAFGLRNVTRIDTALAEARRVLRPGGRFFCLEFSRVTEPFLRRVYDAYSYKIIPRIGSLVARDRGSYEYLIESIRKFPSPQELAARAGKAGFDRTSHISLNFGVVAIHESWKL